MKDVDRMRICPMQNTSFTASSLILDLTTINNEPIRRKNQKMSKQQDMTPPTSAEPPTDNNTDHGIPKVSPTERKKAEDVRDEDLFAYFFPDMASEDDDEAYVEWSQEIDRRNPLHVNSQGPQTEYFAKRAQRTLEFLRRMDNDDVVMAEHEAESARMKLEIEETKLDLTRSARI